MALSTRSLRWLAAVCKPGVAPTFPGGFKAASWELGSFALPEKRAGQEGHCSQFLAANPPRAGLELVRAEPAPSGRLRFATRPPDAYHPAGKIAQGSTSLMTSANSFGLRGGSEQVACETMQRQGKDFSLKERCKCPHCGSVDVRRSKRRGFFELSVLRILPLRPYRCRNCDWRYYSLKRAAQSEQRLASDHLEAGAGQPRGA